MRYDKAEGSLKLKRKILGYSAAVASGMIALLIAGGVGYDIGRTQSVTTSAPEPAPTASWALPLSTDRCGRTAIKLEFPLELNRFTQPVLLASAIADVLEIYVAMPLGVDCKLLVNHADSDYSPCPHRRIPDVPYTWCSFNGNPATPDEPGVFIVDVVKFAATPEPYGAVMTVFDGYADFLVMLLNKKDQLTGAQRACYAGAFLEAARQHSLIKRDDVTKIRDFYPDRAMLDQGITNPRVCTTL